MLTDGVRSFADPSAPTNLTWTPDQDKTGTGRLSWESEEDPSSISYYYLHLNSSTGDKLLYRIEGTEVRSLMLVCRSHPPFGHVINHVFVLVVVGRAAYRRKRDRVDGVVWF